jgi:hypothetical protein
MLTDLERRRQDMNTQDLVDAVRDYALSHCEQVGWDIVVECYTDEDLAIEIGRATTVKGAIRNVGAAVGVYDPR